MPFYDYPLDVRVFYVVGLYTTIYAALAVAYLTACWVLGTPGRRRKAADRAAKRAELDARVASSEAAAKVAVAEAHAARRRAQDEWIESRPVFKATAGDRTDTDL